MKEGGTILQRLDNCGVISLLWSPSKCCCCLGIVVLRCSSLLLKEIKTWQPLSNMNYWWGRRELRSSLTRPVNFFRLMWCYSSLLFFSRQPPFAIWEVSFIIDGRWSSLMHYWWGWWSCYTLKCKRKGHARIILLKLTLNIPTLFRNFGVCIEQNHVGGVSKGSW